MQFNLAPADILKNHERDQSFLFFSSSISLSNKKVSSTINMQRKGFIKSLPGTGFLLPFYELMKLGILAK